MNIPSTYLASTQAASDAGIFGALGIDWRLLAFQTVAFLLLLVFLRKVVYPPLLRALDERQKTIDAGIKAAQEAEKRASQSQEEVEKLLKKARQEADGIVATAKSEAVASIENAEKKAKAKANRIIEQAHERLEQDVRAARQDLRKDTLELVALATEKIIKSKLDAKTDTALVESFIKEAQ